MAMFAGILDRIRTKKKALALNAQDAFYELLREVASGKEVDVDEAAIIIDAAGKSEDDFERDVRTVEQRIPLAEQLKMRLEIERSLPGLRAKLDAANQSYTDAVQRLQPAINIAYTALQNAENQRLSLSYVDAKLFETCLNKSLLEKESELIAQRKEIHSKRGPLFEDLRAARACAQTLEACIDGQAAKMKSESRPDRDNACAETKKWASQLRQQESLIEQLSEAVAKLDAELTPITTEQASIAKKKLVP